MRIAVLDDTYRHSAKEVADALGTTDVTAQQCLAVAAKLDCRFRIDGETLIFDFTRCNAVIVA